MDRRKFRLISLCVVICGVLLVLAAVIAYGVAVREFIASRQENGTGIIGGSDTYPWRLIRAQSLLNGAIPVALFFGMAIFLSGIFALIFAGVIQSKCSFKTSALSLGLSASISLGVYGLFSLIMCSFLSTPSRHPIRYPLSFVVCFVALGASSILFLMYFDDKIKKMSFWSLLLDVPFAIVYLIPFFSLYTELDELLKILIF
ncbi:MAG: hypothetical protein IKJ07_03970 [Clostridia bacterium]|nr:hypothetical protein [Clostridia bacterium]